jgi:cold shock CspA family protein
MAKSQQSFAKKEKEKLRAKKKEEKEKKKADRKSGGSSSFDEMIAYVDEFGNISATPPDPSKKKEIDADSIDIGVPTREQEDAPNPNKTGIVAHFEKSKGYGFIKDKETQESYFTHISGHIDAIAMGDKVTFKLEKGPKGMNAVEVKLLG